MGVFEDAVTNAKSAAATVGKEAGRIVDISKLRLNASEIQRDISKKYEMLGKMVYDASKSGHSAGIGFDEHIEELNVLFQKLDEVNEKISALSRKTVCPRCGAKNDEKAVFCSRCGARLGEHPAEAAPSAPEEEKAESDASI